MQYFIQVKFRRLLMRSGDRALSSLDRLQNLEALLNAFWALLRTIDESSWVDIFCYQSSMQVNEWVVLFFYFWNEIYLRSSWATRHFPLLHLLTRTWKLLNVELLKAIKISFVRCHTRYYQRFSAFGAEFGSIADISVLNKNAIKMLKDY